MSKCSSRKIKGITLIATLFLSLVGFQKSAYAQPDGAKLFKANCASCHHPTKLVVGPALMGVGKRWADAGVKDKIYDWIQNPKKTLDAGIPYVKTLVESYNAKGTALMTAQAVNKEEIDAILAYVETGGDGPKKASASYDPHPESYFAQEPESSSWTLWMVIFGVIFATIAISMGGVRKQLTRAQLDKLGKPVDEESTYMGDARSWMWKNKKLVSVIGLFLTFMLLSAGWYSLKDIGVFEGYKPKQPIWFSHEIHAGLNKIDCQYCHAGVEKSRHATLPTAMVCMNCHKAIQEGGLTGKEEIAKIYKATGFDPATNTYTGKTQPIKWVKVHALPDHVYFNHSQHVVAGKIECKQCHGEMEKIDVARIQPSSVLNAIEGNIKIVSRPTLTMGWCIDCHSQAKVQMDGNGYYDEMKKRLLLDKKLYQKHLDDENITVKDMGGWECSKCHY